MNTYMDRDKLERAFGLLAERLLQLGAPRARLVVCGGSALIAMAIVSRTTRDVDIVAMLDEHEKLVEPVPLPPLLVQAARDIAPLIELGESWLNNGPSRGEGGLFQMGLPPAFASRLVRRDYGDRLSIYFIGRLDQIFFKIYAGTDRGGRDLTDLAALNPTEDEVEAAARWATTNDVSDSYRLMLKTMLRKIGYEQVAERV
ncbi:MAG: hypothetical protein BWY59_02052 [Verrucomicrobia bacterium ADurb.Bin345]|nr:MAG: hypothetical protein BWY59_02052 [Verrucomicrobia bacterium ADurb.Bin345]